MKTAILRQKADYVGIIGSILCLIHCLAAPIVVMSSTLLNHESFRVGFLSLDYLFIGVNILAVWSASRHTSRRIALALWTFLALFTAGVSLEDVQEGFAYLAYVASLGLIITHLVNIWYGRTYHLHH